MRITFGLVISFFIWNLQSCKEVLPVRVITASSDTTFMTSSLPSPQSKVVLLEEYTGTSCPNCPDGHKISKEILSQYGKNVIVVALHPAGNSLTKPAKIGAEDVSIGEARTLQDKFGVGGLPNATIDRRVVNGNIVHSRFVWKDIVQLTISNPVKANVKSRVFLDDKSGKSVLELEYTILEDISDDLNYTLLMVEDKVVLPQKNGTEIIESDTQSHIARKFYTSALGNNLTKMKEDNGIYKKGRVFLKRLIVEDLSALKFKPENLYFVTMITNVKNNEVLQSSYCKAKL